MKNGKNLVIDNLNATTKAREIYIDLAQENELTEIKCLYFETTKEQCMTNNALRKGEGGYLHMSGSVGKVVIHSYFKNHEKPSLEEGFTEIVNIPYVPYKEIEVKELEDKNKVTLENTAKWFNEHWKIIKTEFNLCNELVKYLTVG